jgi:hypothetical protein
MCLTQEKAKLKAFLPQMSHLSIKGVNDLWDYTDLIDYYNNENRHHGMHWIKT